MADQGDPDATGDEIEQSDASEKPLTPDQMPIMEHLDELRTRIIISLVSIVVGFIIAFTFREWILIAALHPYHQYDPDFRPVVLDVTERFFNYFKVSIASGLVIASPVIIGQFWGFISPALLPHEKRYTIPVLPFILILFLGGVLFGYFLVLPVALKFLLSFGSDQISNQIRLDRAINFVVNTCLATGIVFQLPTVVFLLSKVGIVNQTFLRRQRRIAIVIMMIIAAAITPTIDPFTMLLVATPMLILYEISIYVAKISAPRPKPDDEQTVSHDEET